MGCCSESLGLSPAGPGETRTQIPSLLSRGPARWMWIPPCSGCWAFAGPYSAEGDGAAAAAAPPPDSERTAQPPQRNILKSAGCLRIAATAPCSGGFCAPFSNCCNLPWQQLLQPAVAITAATCSCSNCCNLQLQPQVLRCQTAIPAPLPSESTKQAFGLGGTERFCSQLGSQSQPHFARLSRLSGAREADSSLSSL
jgi:hypothetical protein